MNRLVLLDRDGTINVDRHYLSASEQLELLPRAAEGIRAMRFLGLKVMVITNQSGVGRGYFSLKALEQIHQDLQMMLGRQGATLDAIYFCPHGPADGCACRKPAPGLAYRAAEDFQADLSEAFVIGDRLSDIEMGRRVRAMTILVKPGGTVGSAEAQPNHIASDLFEAARWIGEILRV